MAERLRDRSAPARLVAVFDHYAYVGLDFDGDEFIVAFSSPDMPSGPLTVAIAPWPLWSQSEGRLYRNTLYLGDLRIDFDDAETWPSAIGKTCRHDHLPTAARLTALLSGLQHHSDLLAAILARPDTLSIPLCDLALLASGLAGKNMDALSRGAEGLIGLGRGLTPSGDDFLCGVMTALWVFADAPEEQCSAIARAAPGRTTSLSLAFLAAAAEGHVNQQWRALLSALGDGLPDTVLIQHLAAVTAMGHSSGADALAGFVWASRRMG